MNKTVVAAIIGGSATIIAAFIGLFVGKSTEQKNIQNEINEVMGDMVNIIGDGNEITINDMKTLIEEYQNLQDQNKTLIEQNKSYFNQLAESKDQIEKLDSKIDNIPIIDYNDLALCIDVNDIPINKNKSMIIIDGREYLSKEIVEKIIPNDKYITIKNDTIFIGQVVTDRANLFDQRIMDQNAMFMADAITDSYGNNYSNALYAKTTYTGGYNTVYWLDEKYSYLKFKIAIREDAETWGSGILTIKADEAVVYTSETLNKFTEPFIKTDIPINNCKRLSIEYTSSFYVDCIISDAIVYN